MDSRCNANSNSIYLYNRFKFFFNLKIAKNGIICLYNFNISWKLNFLKQIFLKIKRIILIKKYDFIMIFSKILY